jgi:hypothetical protein
VSDHTGNPNAAREEKDMKKALQNVALVASLVGVVVVAYGPNAKARNYSGGVSWAHECIYPRDDQIFPTGCSLEEAREQYVDGSYKEEVMYEPATVSLHAEETREIADWPFGASTQSWCMGHKMLFFFENALGRGVDWDSSVLVYQRAGSCSSY